MSDPQSDDDAVEESPDDDPTQEAPTQVDRVLDHWDAVIGDMEATAAEYREDGWEVLEVHPGDVAAVTEGEALDRWGLDVLVPDDEFDEVERLVVEEDGEFDECEVFRADAGGMVYVVVAMLDEAAEVTIVFPAYYDPRQSEDVFRRASRTGEMRTHLRPLDERTIVTFRQDDPSLFTPD